VALALLTAHSANNWDAVASSLVDLLYVFFDDNAFDVPAAALDAIFGHFLPSNKHATPKGRRLAAELLRKCVDQMQLEFEKVRPHPPGSQGPGSC